MTDSDRVSRHCEVVIGGSTYALHPMRVRYARDYDSWLTDQIDQLPNPFAEMKNQVEGLPLELQQRYLDQALEETRRIREPGSAQMRGLAFSVEATTRLLWAHLRPDYPELKLERIREHVEESSLTELQALLDRVNHLGPAARSALVSEAPDSGNPNGRSTAHVPSGQESTSSNILPFTGA